MMTSLSAGSSLSCYRWLRRRTVFEQQILGAFGDRFVLFTGLAMLAVFYSVDHTAKGGHEMEEIQDDLGCRQF